MLGGISAGFASGVKKYESVDNLPFTGVKPGTLAHVAQNTQGSGALYLWTCSAESGAPAGCGAWNRVATVNSAPVITSFPDIGYFIDTDDGQINVKVEAFDPDGLPLQFSVVGLQEEQSTIVVDQTAPGEFSFSLTESAMNSELFKSFDIGISVSDGMSIAAAPLFVRVESWRGPRDISEADFAGSFDRGEQTPTFDVSRFGIECYAKNNSSGTFIDISNQSYQFDVGNAHFVKFIDDETVVVASDNYVFTFGVSKAGIITSQSANLTSISGSEINQGIVSDSYRRIMHHEDDRLFIATPIIEDGIHVRDVVELVQLVQLEENDGVTTPVLLSTFDITSGVSERKGLNGIAFDAVNSVAYFSFPRTNENLVAVDYSDPSSPSIIQSGNDFNYPDAGAATGGQMAYGVFMRNSMLYLVTITRLEVYTTSAGGAEFQNSIAVPVYDSLFAGYPQIDGRFIYMPRNDAVYVFALEREKGSPEDSQSYPLEVGSLPVSEVTEVVLAGGLAYLMSRNMNGETITAYGSLQYEPA
ncbi:MULTISPECIES: hypothetical protein [unclassified Yoonia]|uniref:hypothetical protein n=1 Tax=unclassified Yoonia TaxID=2629118 RepID=UPI002AFE2C5E|nr:MULTISPECIES: hypothetical protein [unclassified Yoonia]